MPELRSGAVLRMTNALFVWIVRALEPARRNGQHATVGTRYGCPHHKLSILKNKSALVNAWGCLRIVRTHAVPDSPVGTTPYVLSTEMRHTAAEIVPDMDIATEMSWQFRDLAQT
eukprot:6214757-Pleurochrysis_carterae.AAC.5